MTFEQRSGSAESDKLQAIEKINNEYLPRLQKSIDDGDSNSAFSTFLLLLTHLKNHELVDEDLLIPIAEIAKEQALFHWRYAQKLHGRPGCKMEIEKLEHCLEKGNLTYRDVGLTAEEINELAKTAAKH
ncbi:MAG: hypothetical protein NTZ18_01975 [Candidatus Komeilibacteria bacterium]|nr:hypothetical protein [Candidatus Komeilibacteria bacterium]